MDQLNQLKYQIQPIKEIKSLGKFKVFINLHSEIQFSIFVNVIPEEEKL